MKKISIWLVIVALTVTMALAGVACKTATAETTEAETTVAAETTAAAPKKLKVGFGYSYGTHPGVILYREGAMAGLQDPRWAEAGYEVEIVQADGGWDDVDAKMVTVIEDLYSQGLDGLLLFNGGCGLPPGTPVKELFNKNNIPVALMEYMAYIKDVDYVIWAGPDFYKWGIQAGEVTAKYLQKGDETIAIATISTDPSGLLCTDGYKLAVEKAGLIYLEPLRAETATLEVGRKLAEDALTANPNLKAIYTSAPTLAEGILQTLKEKNLGGKVVLVTHFATNLVYQAVQTGEVTACMMGDMFNIGFIPAEGLMLHLTGQPVPQKDVPMDALVLDKDNYKDFADDPSVQPAE